jgi:hypothetical protein
MTLTLTDSDKQAILRNITSNSGIIFMSDDTHLSVGFKIVFKQQKNEDAIKFNINDTPMRIIKSLQTFFEDKFMFGKENFNQVVSDCLNYAQSLLPGQDKLIAKERKDYAREYYSIFKLKTVSNRVGNVELQDKVKIIVNVISYIFIRRLMHIFIVSNIVEHTTLNNTITPIPSTSTTGEDKYELENIKTKLEAQIASLQSQAASSSTINKDTLTELKKECEILTKSLLEKNNKIAELKALLESYKELLLDSTQLIFKMDDIDISKS